MYQYAMQCKIRRYKGRHGSCLKRIGFSTRKSEGLLSFVCIYVCLP